MRDPGNLDETVSGVRDGNGDGPSAAFTPGPWRMAWVAEGGFHIEDADKNIICRRGHWPHNAERSGANARLIAAAPDQHAALDDAEAALTALINRYGYEDDNATPKDWNEWVFARAARDAARAAIDKALIAQAADTSARNVPAREGSANASRAGTRDHSLAPTEAEPSGEVKP